MEQKIIQIVILFKAKENKKWNMINVIDNGYIWNGIYNSSSTVL